MKDLIYLIPTEHLPQFEAYFKKLLAHIHTKVVDSGMAQVKEKERKRHKASLDENIRRALAKVRAGMARHLAIEEGCDEPPYPDYSVLDAWLKMAEKRAVKADRQRRNDKIRSLRADGLTNAAIAAKIGVSVSTVANALKGGPK